MPAIRTLLLAMLFAVVLACFGAPAQACPHESASAPVTTPAADPSPAPVPPCPDHGTPERLHACCAPPLLPPRLSVEAPREPRDARYAAPASTRAQAQPPYPLDRPPKPVV